MAFQKFSFSFSLFLSLFLFLFEGKPRGNNVTGADGAGGVGEEVRCEAGVDDPGVDGRDLCLGWGQGDQGQDPHQVTHFLWSPQGWRDSLQVGFSSRALGGATFFFFCCFMTDFYLVFFFLHPLDRFLSRMKKVMIFSGWSIKMDDLLRIWRGFLLARSWFFLWPNLKRKVVFYFFFFLFFSFFFLSLSLSSCERKKRKSLNSEKPALGMVRDDRN